MSFPGRKAHAGNSPDIAGSFGEVGGAASIVGRNGDGNHTVSALRDGVPGMEALRRSVLEETLRDYEGFVEQLQDDSGMRFALALSYSHIGTMHEQLGRTGESLVAYDKAKELYLKLIDEQPDVTRFRHDLAICHNNMGDVFFQQGEISRGLRV